MRAPNLFRWEPPPKVIPFPLVRRRRLILNAARSMAVRGYELRSSDRLYPSDPWQAALCDEAMEAAEDITTKIFASRFLPEQQKRADRKALVEGPLPLYLNQLERRLETHGGLYFADNRLSVADLKVFELIRSLRSGAIDHVPTDLADRFAPKLVEHYERVKNDPRVSAYYSKRGVD